jgi:hypothetical protein
MNAGGERPTLNRGGYGSRRCEPTVMAADEERQERLVWIGPDDRGVGLEVIAIVEPDYLLVIHVMPHQFRRRTP